jgi:hypothetical protein
MVAVPISISPLVSGTTDGEAVLAAKGVPETAQNEPKIPESPTGESGQLGVIDPIVSVETSTGEDVASELILTQVEAGAQAPSLQADNGDSHISL